jgi:predicted nucleotidyltransferase
MPLEADLAGQLIAALEQAAPDSLASAYLFGSRAEGHPHLESDVDVGVLFRPDMLRTSRERFDAGLVVSSRLQAALGTTRIDVVVLNDAPAGLGRHVVVTGRRLVCPDAGADHAFVRDVQLRAADLAPFLRRARRIKLEAMAR